MRNEFVAQLTEMARLDKSIFLVTGDLGYGVLDSFASEFPNQYLNCGISEQSMIGVAAALARNGRRVFVYSIANFSTLRCLEQIRNDVCYPNLPVTIVSVGAGFAYGAQGYSHHALEDISAMRCLPNLEVFSPFDPISARFLTKLSSENPGPGYLRLGKGGEPILSSGSANSNLGHYGITKMNDGDDGTILFTGSIGKLALDAAHSLSNLAINIGVYSVTCLNNFEIEVLLQRLNLGKIVTVEEHVTKGGFGSLILEKLSSKGIAARVSMIGVDFVDFSVVGSQNFLRERHGLTVEKIAQNFKK